MNLSQLISQLIEMKKQRGNLRVVVAVGNDDMTYTVTHVHASDNYPDEAMICFASGPHCSECGRGCE